MQYSAGRCALIGFFAFNVSLLAQSTLPTFLTGVSTGVVSMSLNQTAQLNVVNLNPVAGTTGATATICTVQLEFYDASGGLLKQEAINNVPPGTAASLTLRREEASTNLSVPRLAVRGVVRTNPITPTATGASPIMFAGCPVKTTLEIYNDDTGNTQLVMSDVSPITQVVLPANPGVK